MYTNSMEPIDCNTRRRLVKTNEAYGMRALRSLIQRGQYELAAYRLVCGVLVEARKADGRQLHPPSTLDTSQAGRGSSR